MVQNIKGNIVNIQSGSISRGILSIENGKITTIDITGPEDPSIPYILPGFIDAHVHIESSMLVPSEFARLAVVHGTVATISDPHEIANVCGVEGVEYMIANGKTVPFKFHFGAPSCVPATIFETAGATIDSHAVRALLLDDDIYYLSEMMNFPGVLHNDPEVMQKIAFAREIGKPVDGHAPGLMGDDAVRYIRAGIDTDHECFTAEEARHKLDNGMKILIREGSAAKNFEALIGLLPEHEDKMMFCSDDKHPDSLVQGHINSLCARAVAKGINVFQVLKAACINPILHYGMRVGLLCPGDNADFILCRDLKDFDVLATYIDGVLVAENGCSLIDAPKATVINQFKCNRRAPEDFIFPALSDTIRVIHALDGQLITESSIEKPLSSGGNFISDTNRDLLKIAVVNRYQPDVPVALAFIHNFGLKKGAIASSVAHDSHNIVAVGVDDESICRAVNLVIENAGGISCAHPIEPQGSWTLVGLPLPVAGLMSNENGYMIADQYSELDKVVKEILGSTLTSPFMTLSFMALLVIPKLKLSDKGLFDGERFCFV